MEKDWTFSRGDTDPEKAYKELGETLETDNHMFRTMYGWFFCDKAEYDSFGPFETKEECSQSMKEYAKTL